MDKERGYTENFDTDEARYFPARPRSGSKKRDAKTVVARIEAYQPTKIVALVAGQCGELTGLKDGPWRLVLADIDPAERALWAAANVGNLLEAAERAKQWWLDLLGTPERRTLSPRDRVRTAWEELRISEPPVDEVTELAAWAIAVGAGSNNGLWRRNPTTGVVNHPYSAGYDPTFLPSRIFGGKKWRENARAANRWAKGRVDIIYRDWRPLIATSWIFLDDGEKVFLLVDPPYSGEGEHGLALYSGTWPTKERDDLARYVINLVGHGAQAAIWCGPNDIDAYAPLAVGTQVQAPTGTWCWWPDCVSTERAVSTAQCPRRRHGIEWRFRKTKTLVKAARQKKDGSTEPPRHGKGGWLGLTG